MDAIVAGTLAYFSESHPLDGYPPHRCPAPEWEPDPLGSFSSGITPYLTLNCNESPDGQCGAIDETGGPFKPGEYAAVIWTDNPIWVLVGFAKLTPHAFHYALNVNNEPDEYGRCSFTASAYADFDDDIVFSTYELRGTVDQDGPVLEPLFIDKPCE